MKTKEELNALKEKAETVSEKLAELTEEELAQVSGGLSPAFGHKSVHEPDVSKLDFEPTDFELPLFSTDYTYEYGH